MGPRVSSLTCTFCHVEFLPNEGGVCASCRRPFCAFDLRGDRGDSPFCRSCRPGDEGRPLVDAASAASLWERRKVALKLHKK